MQKEKGCAWVISVDMGYGHQRAAYPLKDIAYERIITANSDKIISFDEKKIWERTRAFYETISRLKKIPLFGKLFFGIYDNLQSISPFYPFRDLSKPNFGSLMLRRSIKNGLCKSLIDYVKKKDIPFITTHPFPAIAAHYFGLKKIFCVVTDTDINRSWVVDNPKENTITYFAPCVHVAVRLREYGISEDRIIMTGFPLPKENIGSESMNLLRKDLVQRLLILDPNKVFIRNYKEVVEKRLGFRISKAKPKRKLTLTYAVGGAGAQMEVGMKIIKSLKEEITKGEIILNVSAGTRLDVLSYYNKQIESIGMKKELGKNIRIIFALEKRKYFSALNEELRKTDILWTKPSEMVFYTALGLPIIIAPPIGAHENYNMDWLRNMGSGYVQEKPEFCADWLYYWLADGRLAQAAWQGFTEAPVLGTYKIEKILKEVK